MSINCTNITSFSPSSSETAVASTETAIGGTIIAIVCVIVSSLSTTFGLFFQKIAQERGGVCGHPDDVKHEKYISFAYWFGGFSLITLVSFGLDLYSMASLGQSLVVPLLAGLEVAENQVFAPMVLHAELNKRYDYSAAVVVLFGAVLTSIWGPKGGTTSFTTVDPCNATAVALKLSEYQETRLLFDGLFVEPLFVVYEIIVVVGFIFCIYCMKVEPTFCKNYMFMVYGYVAGFLGGQQNLFLKGVGTLFTLAFGDSPGAAAEVFSDYYFYIFLAMMLILAPTQLAIINIGLGKFSVLRFVPAYTVLYIIMGTSVGLFFYQEWKQLGALDWVMFSIGFVFIFCSLGILGLKPESVYTVKVKYEDKYHDITWYPHRDPQDSVLELTKRVVEQLKLDANQKMYLMLPKHPKGLDPDELIIDLVIDIQNQNDEYHSVLGNDPDHEITLELEKIARKPTLTEAQSLKARKSWGFGINAVITQQRIVHKIKGQSVVRRVRNSVFTMLTHGHAEDSNDGSKSLPKSSQSAPSIKNRSGVKVNGRSKTMKVRRRSSVMIAFGGGLLMSHSMASKKLKGVRKGGEDKKGAKGYMLRKMAHTQKVNEERSQKYSTMSIMSTMKESDEAEEEEENEGLETVVASGDVALNIELGELSEEKKQGSKTTVANAVTKENVV